jgi:hypothetical protein
VAQSHVECGENRRVLILVSAPQRPQGQDKMPKRRFSPHSKRVSVPSRARGELLLPLAHVQRLGAQATSVAVRQGLASVSDALNSGGRRGR